MNLKLHMVYKRFFNHYCRFLLLLLCLQSPQFFFGQSKSIITSWQITARSAGNASGFDIRIEQLKDKTNFFFKRIDSLRQRDMEKDQTYTEQRAAVKASSSVEEITYQIEKLAAIIELFEVSEKDTLSSGATLPDLSLDKLLDSLSNIPAELLHHTNQTNNDNQVAGDYSFHFIRFNGRKKTADFFTTQPTALSHPYLFRLVSATLTFYRKEKTNAVLSADFTRPF